MTPSPTPTSRLTNYQLQLSENFRDIKALFLKLESRIETSIQDNTDTINVPRCSLIAPVPEVATRLIRDCIWKFNFKSNDLVKVQANKNKPIWKTDVYFNKSSNKELVLELLAYLGQCSSMKAYTKRIIMRIPTRTFVGDVAKKRRLLRHGSRQMFVAEKPYFNRRRVAYHSNKDAIVSVMGNDCSALIQKAVMSEGESEDEIPRVSDRRMIRTIRPSWKSNEFNQSNALMDSYSLLGLGVNVRQMLLRVFDCVADLAVPERITPPLSQWALRE
ncbi:hypothetical protein CLU79DRAFT_839961 [Phycomyces nitens]|nr:hypothetical protein CLU79DRAFT_839961 [Phycomyces nitens]